MNDLPIVNYLPIYMNYLPIRTVKLQLIRCYISLYFQTLTNARACRTTKPEPPVEEQHHRNNQDFL